jgi:citrate lyase subunit beta/citryl-CoA lyase
MSTAPSKTSASAGSAARGVAGRRGDEIRSDAWVAVEPRASGGIAVDLTSRVSAYYGDSIRDQTAAVLRALGVEHAAVEMLDTGALPFVLAARTEAAALRAGIAARGDARPPATAPAAAASPRDRLRRSRLYLPGNEPKYFLNAGLYHPDAVILDLEDSVHPDEKDAARLLVRNALRAVDFHDAERMVRINQLPIGLADLEAIVPETPELILVPKVESGEQVREVDAAITRLLRAGATVRPLWIMPIIESALGVERCEEIARASERVVAITIGLEDYAADLGVPKSADGAESAYARARLVNAARAAGVQAIDSVYGQVDDEAGLRAWGERSRQLGFCGMGCLHPRQIAPIHAAYNPTPAQIERALAIVAAFEAAQAAGRGVVSLGSKMIDPPVVKQALILVEQARRLGLVPVAAAATTPASEPGA